MKIKKKLKRFILLTVFIVTAFWGNRTVCGSEVMEISTKEQFYAIRNNPGGHYVLTDDLDMSGIEWVPFEFTGVLEGNNHSLLNLSVNATGEENRTTYCGNYKLYDTKFAGLFSVLSGKVSNLKLVNERVTVDEDCNVFIGGMAGFGENGTVTGCELSGQLELKADAPIFGVGGVIGYGSGVVEDTTIKLTLICIDKNAAEKDEQFLGGVFSGGYVEAENCNIDIQGYVSEHGYAHNGGIAGIYIPFPKGIDYYGRVKDNVVNGTIHFFEDNRDRRAYCASLIGEIMNWNFKFSGNKYGDTVVNSKDQGIRDEIKKYDKDLYPETCDNPDYEVSHTEALPGVFGFDLYTCKNCGYSFEDNYRIFVPPTPTPEPTATPVPPTPTPTVTPEPTKTPVPEVTPDEGAKQDSVDEMINENSGNAVADDINNSSAANENGRMSGGIIIGISAVVLCIITLGAVLLIFKKEK